MVSTGIRTPIGIKVTGDDLTQIEAIAREIEGVVTDIPGTRSAFADRVLGGKYLEITPNRLELARRNIDMGAFQGVIQTALGGCDMSGLSAKRMPTLKISLSLHPQARIFRCAKLRASPIRKDRP